ncbi:MAG TPA: hypothetical protein VF498_17840 [Anaerolineales bacterium]
MAKNGKEKSKKNKPVQAPINGPWISMRTGLIAVTITSIGMAVLTAIQAIPSKGVVSGILWGLIFGGLIWVVFLGFYFINTRLR